MMQPVRQWIDIYNSGKGPLPEDIFARDVVITDEFPPFVWSGSAGERRWAQAIDTYIRPGQQRVSVGAAQSFQQTRDLVRFVLPASLTYRSSRTGTQVTERALWSFVLRRNDEAWKIVADTWTPAAPDPPISVTLQNEGGVLLVPASLDGVGPMLFALDPGANDLYTSYARDRLSGHSPQNVCVAAACYRTAMQLFSGRPEALAPRHDSAKGTLAGSIGPELLRNYVTRIDYKASTLTLTAAERYDAPPGAMRVPLRFDSFGLPVVSATVDGVAGVFEIDVRAPTSMLFRPFLERNGIAARYGSAPVVRQNGALLAHAIHSVRVAGASLNAVPFWFSTDRTGKFSSAEVAGLLGNNVLSHFEVTFDYPHRSVYLTRA